MFFGRTSDAETRASRFPIGLRPSSGQTKRRAAAFVVVLLPADGVEGRAYAHQDDRDTNALDERRAQGLTAKENLSRPVKLPGGGPV
ncbi:MAG: hypothetical protein WBV77_07860 [Solirubrobacteraceae bacterium]